MQEKKLLSVSKVMYFHLKIQHQNQQLIHQYLMDLNQQKHKLRKLSTKYLH